MDLLKKKDDEIFKIADPFWVDLVKASNQQDYGSFTKNFSETMSKLQSNFTTLLLFKYLFDGGIRYS